MGKRDRYNFEFAAKDYCSINFNEDCSGSRVSSRKKLTATFAGNKEFYDNGAKLLECMTSEMMYCVGEIDIYLEVLDSKNKLKSYGWNEFLLEETSAEEVAISYDAANQTEVFDKEILKEFILCWRGFVEGNSSMTPEQEQSYELKKLKRS